MRCLLAALILFSAGLAVRADDLNKLIPELYGGNGITLGTTGGFSEFHRAHFQDETGSAIRQLNNRLGRGFGAFPVSSSAGNFAFAFDPDLNTFVNTTETLGPIFAERARTIGKGKWSLTFYTTFFDYDTFNGQDLHNLHVRAFHDVDTEVFDPDTPGGIGIPGVRTGFENDYLDVRFNIDASVRIYSPAVTYGVTDKLDISAIIPIVQMDMDVRSDYTLVVSPDNPTKTIHDTNVLHGASPPSRKRASASGIGDIVLGAKYEFYRGVVDVAGVVLGQFATGDEKNFLGTGDNLIRPFAVVSKTFRSIAGTSLSLTPHVNLGYQYDIDHADRSALEYVGGFDFGTRRITLANEVLGSHDNQGLDRVDYSVGLKWNFYKRFVLAGNVILPLNDTGVRSDLITTVGLGVSF